MKKLLLALVLWPLTTLGQSPPVTVSGNITTNGSDCLVTTAACVTAKLSKDSGAATIQISGTWTGTISFEATTDGTNWVAINGTPLNSTTPATSTTGNGVWRFNVSANTYIHARGSNTITGTAAVVISNGTGSASTGTGGSGNTTSASMTTNTVPKATGANAIGDSLFTDDGTTGSYAGTGGFTVPNAPPALSGTTASSACATTSATAGQVCIDKTTLLPVAGNSGGSNLPLLWAGSMAAATLTDGATVTWATASNPTASAVLTFTTHGGSRTLNLTGLVSGVTYVLKLVQDATGGENLAGGTGCTWKQLGGGGGTFTLTATASAVDFLTFFYDGTNCYASLGKAYA